MELSIEIQSTKQRNFKKDIKLPEERAREQRHKKEILEGFELKYSNAFQLIKERFHPDINEPMYMPDLVVLCKIINDHVKPPKEREYKRDYYRHQDCSYKWIDDTLQTDQDKVMFVLNNFRFGY